MDFSKYAYKSKKKEVADDSISKIQSVNASSSSIKSKSQILKKKVKLELDPIETLDIITKWRETHEAPVDVVGCERLYDRKASEFIQKYQLFVSVFLSVQTKDETTSKVVQRLKDYGLTPDNILKTSQEDLKQLIYEVNFNAKKSQRLLEITKLIKQKGSMPKTLEEVTAFPGVGLKIANIYLKVAQGVITGVGVDTHVHRISNKLGWVNTSSPNKTEQQLQKLFPKERWAGMNIALVGFGQTICDAKLPKCSTCCVKSRCPSAKF